MMNLDFDKNKYTISYNMYMRLLNFIMDMITLKRISADTRLQRKEPL